MEEVMRTLLFLFICVICSSWSFANTTKEEFVTQVNGKMPTNLCKKMSQCYSAKQADCEQKMKPSVQKCAQTANGLIGKMINPELGKASSMLISSCALRYFASENAAKLNKKDKKCEEFSAAALRY
jgi:hypothetical protein